LGANGTVRQESDAIPRRRPVYRKCRGWKSDAVRPHEYEASFNPFVGLGHRQDCIPLQSAEQLSLRTFVTAWVGEHSAGLQQNTRSVAFSCVGALRTLAVNSGTPCLMLQRNVAFHNASHYRCSARRPSSPSPNTVAIKLVKSILVFP